MPNDSPNYSEQTIRACLHTLILGQRIEMREQVGSTNDLARQAGRRGAPEGLVVVTEEQTAGRGRLNRTWTAPPGCCILCSVLLRPHFSPHNAFYLTIAMALAVYRACLGLWATDDGRHGPPKELTSHEDNIKSHITIKWPNDILAGGRKLAGVLCETEISGDDWGFAVVGFGINANIEQNALGQLPSTATSLSSELGRPVDRAALLCRVLGEMEDLYLMLQNGQFGFVYSQWASALDTVGKRISVRDGGQILEGQAMRVDLDGALVLRLDDGTQRRVLAGDIT